MSEAILNLINNKIIEANLQQYNIGQDSLEYYTTSIFLIL
jgi:hypothetical protein